MEPGAERAVPLPHGTKKACKALVTAQMFLLWQDLPRSPTPLHALHSRYRDVRRHESEHLPPLLRTQP